MSLQDSFADFVSFEITSITEGDYGATPSVPIEFEYANPSVGIDTGGNFVKHDIIGGPTVRQKIGTKPLEISVNGVAKESTAQQLELLRNVQSATILSDRFSQDSVTVHVVSVTTDPLEDGGAADLVDADFLYTFSLECVELYGSGQ